MCVYCGGLSDSNDHSPPKCLLEEPFPPNLTTLPCCTGCNQSFSKDEEFTAFVLQHVSGARTEGRSLEFQAKKARILNASPGLREQLKRMYREDGRLEVDAAALRRIVRVAIKCAAGLYYRDYGIIRTQEDFSCLLVEHQSHVDREEALRRFCGNAVWPEVGSASLSRLARYVVVGNRVYYDNPRAVQWRSLQDDVLEYAFGKHTDTEKLVCVLDIRHALVVAVLCPWPCDSSAAQRRRRKREHYGGDS